jgi:hypothetical protein
MSNEEKILKKAKSILLTELKKISEPSEVWAPVNGYENAYYVSDLGKVYSLISNKVLKQKTRFGYQLVELYKSGKSRTQFVHRLVSVAFLFKKEGREFINHIDGNKQNNNVSNLEWCTTQENNIHAFKNGLQKSKLSKEQIEEIRAKSPKRKEITDLAKKFSVHRSTVRDVAKNKSWKYV